jgi:hypothetical protein
MCSSPFGAGDLQVRFDERDVETELWQGYLGTARRKGRQQTTRTYDHRATSRLYRPLARAVRRENSPSRRKLLPFNILERLKLKRVPCRIEEKHGRLLTGLTLKSSVGLDDKIHAPPLHARSQFVPVS